MKTEIVKNESKNIRGTCVYRYGNEIKDFALNLYFYSLIAYKFVSKSLHPPHPTTLRSWCEPGFFEKSLNYIEEKVAEGQQDCALVIDAMSIWRQIQQEKQYICR